MFWIANNICEPKSIIHIFHTGTTGVPNCDVDSWILLQTNPQTKMSTTRKLKIRKQNFHALE